MPITLTNVILAAIDQRNGMGDRDRFVICILFFQVAFGVPLFKQLTRPGPMSCLFLLGV